ncbi:RNA-binding S4 domain-containing protein [soil metagenome]
MRADLYLHHVRIFKTRSLATQACSKNNVSIGGSQIKASRDLKEGDVLEVKRADLRLTLEVVAFPKSRLAASLVSQYMKDLTPPEIYQKAAEARKERQLVMPQGFTLKPDKKQLRQIRRWMADEPLL